MRFGILAALLISASLLAQEPGLRRRLPLAGAKVTSAAKARSAAAAKAPSYNYTLIGFPGTLSTYGVGINPSAVEKADIALVGAEFFPDGSSQTGFLANVFRFGGVIEQYTLLNDPNAPTPQQAYSVNDSGQIVGDYIDSAGVFHSYLLDCGHFKKFDVPFAGATGTFSPAINNAGEIVGSWLDSQGNAHSYTLMAGKFVSFDVPGSAQAQFYYGINNKGAITGSYADASGTVHGFLKKGGAYQVIDYPGAFYTEPTGINDSGDIVGGYCPTSACADTGEGEVGFLLRAGQYNTVTVAGETAFALGSINDEGVVMGNYVDAAGLVYTFLGTPTP